MGPITGDAAFIGKEQLGFARYAIRRLGGGTIKLVESDTRYDPARAATVGARLRANSDVLAVVGPASSQEVLAVGPIFTAANRLPFINPRSPPTSSAPAPARGATRPSTASGRARFMSA